MALVGVILKPCRECLASVDCSSLSNSTNAMSLRPGTNLTSLKPGNLHRKLNMTNDNYWYWTAHWVNSIVSIPSFVSGGRLVRKRILLGASLPVGWPADAIRATRIHMRTHIHNMPPLKQCLVVLNYQNQTAELNEMIHSSSLLACSLKCAHRHVSIVTHLSNLTLFRILLCSGLICTIFLGHSVWLSLGIGYVLEGECMCASCVRGCAMQRAKLQSPQGKAGMMVQYIPK